jgi:hypothetical protein
VLGDRKRTRFSDHLLVTADANPHEDAALLRRQAIDLLGFDTRPTTAEWLHAEQLRALRGADRTDHVPSWVAVRYSAVALAHSGNRDPFGPVAPVTTFAFGREGGAEGIDEYLSVKYLALALGQG